MLGGTTVIINNACNPGSDAANSATKGINYDSMIVFLAEIRIVQITVVYSIYFQHLFFLRVLPFSGRVRTLQKLSVTLTVCPFWKVEP